MLKRTAAMACRDSQVMQRALDMHDTVLRALLARYYGYEVTTEGDSFTMAFHDPVDAVLLLHSPLCTSPYLGGSSSPQVKPRQPCMGCRAHNDQILATTSPSMLMQLQGKA